MEECVSQYFSRCLISAWIPISSSLFCKNVQNEMIWGFARGARKLCSFSRGAHLAETRRKDKLMSASSQSFTFNTGVSHRTRLHRHFQPPASPSSKDTSCERKNHVTWGILTRACVQALPLKGSIPTSGTSPHHSTPAVPALGSALPPHHHRSYSPSICSSAAQMSPSPLFITVWNHIWIWKF